MNMLQQWESDFRVNHIHLVYSFWFSQWLSVFCSFDYQCLQQKISLRVLQMITFCCVLILSSGCPRCNHYTSVVCCDGLGGVNTPFRGVFTMAGNPPQNTTQVGGLWEPVGNCQASGLWVLCPHISSSSKTQCTHLTEGSYITEYKFHFSTLQGYPPHWSQLFIPCFLSFCLFYTVGSLCCLGIPHQNNKRKNKILLHILSSLFLLVAVHNHRMFIHSEWTMFSQQMRQAWFSVIPFPRRFY